MEQVDTSHKLTRLTDGHIAQIHMSHRWTCLTDGHISQVDMSHTLAYALQAAKEKSVTLEEEI